MWIWRIAIVDYWLLVFNTTFNNFLVAQWNLSKPNLHGTNFSSEYTDVWITQVKLSKISNIWTLFIVKVYTGFCLDRFNCIYIIYRVLIWFDVYKL